MRLDWPKELDGVWWCEGLFVKAVLRRWLCPKPLSEVTAVPSDVRKASGLPASSILNFGLRPGFGAQPQIRCAIDGSAERFRTSGGIAEFRSPNFLGRPTRMGKSAICEGWSLNIS